MCPVLPQKKRKNGKVLKVFDFPFFLLFPSKSGMAATQEYHLQQRAEKSDSARALLIKTDGGFSRPLLCKLRFATEKSDLKILGLKSKLGLL